ncbi:MAG: ATP-binding protein [Muribaculaceae bacterium]|nr:ATP-binding protein [Muribaculaceae bacterium]
MEKLIGRNREIAELERCLSSERSEFVVVSGRRRIGKTFLVNTVLKGRTTMSFVGSHKSPKARQLQKFAQAMQQSALCDVLPQLTSWYDAFDVLEAALSKCDVGIKKVLFFDEMPWIDTPGSEFVAALEDFWNGWASLRDDIMLVACGSATSWLVDQLIENQGGLHNRVTSRIALQPFNLNECKQYVESKSGTWDYYQIAQMYMYLGGVPFYWSLLDFTKGIAENVDELFFTPSAKLKGEFGELYQVLFRNSQPYVDIVRQIAMRREGLSRQEIVDATGTSGGSLTKMLANLERCNFIMAQTPLDNKRNGNIYRVCDFYTLFYFRFIEPERQNTLHYWTTKITSPSVSAWQGLTFELIGLLHIDQIRMALGIYGVSVRCSSWRSTNNAEGPGAQIDLVIERADRITHLCEFKFAPDEYVITSDYARRLRERMSVYRSQAKKRNTLLITFVTPFGVSKGKNYSVVQGDITLPQLFAPAM